MAARRQSSLLASKRIQSQLGSYEETIITTEKPKPKSSPRKRPSKRVSYHESDASEADANGTPPRPVSRPVKRLRRDKTSRGSASISDLHQRLFNKADSTSGPPAAPCHFPLRKHHVHYHRPQLLEGELGKRGRSSLLDWYDAVNTNRSMPWRKPFINSKDYTDAEELRRALTQRAYEVFISEIMLQQTRVKTVIEYWNRWMEKWPTIYDLANADDDDVMSAWRGLGYYSRCKRIVEACRMVVEHPDWRGLMPNDARELEAQIPGVGPYTAGAISSIVFGRAAPMVDGNVLRVLSRQLGLLADTKTDKVIIDLIWACARSLVKTVSLDVTGDEETGEARPNDAPGRWGQALMELGSTVCTPNPNCSVCPVTTTCRAYQEGRILAQDRNCPGSGSAAQVELPDIEDICQLCEPYVDIAVEPPAAKGPAKTPKQPTLSSFFTSSASKQTRKKAEESSREALSPEALRIVVSHAQKFPIKLVKKALREQETLVCAVRRVKDGAYLLQRRPEKGESHVPLCSVPDDLLHPVLSGFVDSVRGVLLASHFMGNTSMCAYGSTGCRGPDGPCHRPPYSRTQTKLLSLPGLLAGMWEFPSEILPDSNSSTAGQRKKLARELVTGLFQAETAPGKANMQRVDLGYVGELGSVPWTFSHLKLTMHVHLFELNSRQDTALAENARPRRWATAEAVEAETMGTGMRQCWKLVAEAAT